MAGSVDSFLLQVALVFLWGLVLVSPQLLCRRSVSHFWWVPAPLSLLQPVAFEAGMQQICTGRQFTGTSLHCCMSAGVRPGIIKDHNRPLLVHTCQVLTPQRFSASMFRSVAWLPVCMHSHDTSDSDLGQWSICSSWLYTSTSTACVVQASCTFFQMQQQQFQIMCQTSFQWDTSLLCWVSLYYSCSQGL